MADEQALLEFVRNRQEQQRQQEEEKKIKEEERKKQQEQEAKERLPVSVEIFKWLESFRTTVVFKEICKTTDQVQLFHTESVYEASSVLLLDDGRLRYNYRSKWSGRTRYFRSAEELAADSGMRYTLQDLLQHLKSPTIYEYIRMNL